MPMHCATWCARPGPDRWGSVTTALSARMDPEDLRDVISAYQKCVAETLRRFGGFVAKYMGDLASGEKGRCTPSDLGLLY